MKEIKKHIKIKIFFKSNLFEEKLKKETDLKTYLNFLNSHIPLELTHFLTFLVLKNAMQEKLLKIEFNNA